VLCPTVLHYWTVAWLSTDLIDSPGHTILVPGLRPRLDALLAPSSMVVSCGLSCSCSLPQHFRRTGIVPRAGLGFVSSRPLSHSHVPRVLDNSSTQQQPTCTGRLPIRGSVECEPAKRQHARTARTSETTRCMLFVRQAADYGTCAIRRGFQRPTRHGIRIRLHAEDGDGRCGAKSNT